MTTRGQYNQKRKKLLAQFASLKHSSKSVATNKKSTNLFRGRKQKHVKRLSLRDLSGVISIDTTAKLAVVEGMCTYETLVAETLQRGLMPAVVPQLKTITLGGAVTGIGIESSSFKYGFPHETVTQMEILTGQGKILTIKPAGPHKDLFYAFPNSYGSLGYALCLTIKLIPVKQYVHLRHIRFSSARDYFAAMKKACAESMWEGAKVDFVDGAVFGPREMYMVVGRMVANVPYTSNYTYKQIYYKSIRKLSEDYLAIADYIWRWDTDWFWCSKNLGAQNWLIRRLYGRQRLRSDVYMKLFGLETKYGPKRKLDRLMGKPEREMIVQDVEVPVGSAETFLKFFNASIGIKPIWVCPTQQLSANQTWTLYNLKPKTLYINFGFWDSAERKPNWSDDHLNRKIEQMVEKLGGKKSLYSTSYYSEKEFWKLYNGRAYAIVKSKYDPEGRFKDLYAKTVKKG